MANAGFCHDCTWWRFEANPALKNDAEREGFGICERIAEMNSNRVRAMVRADDEFAAVETRGEFGCILYEARG